MWLNCRTITSSVCFSSVLELFCVYLCSSIKYSHQGGFFLSFFFFNVWNAKIIQVPLCECVWVCVRGRLLFWAVKLQSVMLERNTIWFVMNPETLRSLLGFWDETENMKLLKLLFFWSLAFSWSHAFMLSCFQVVLSRCFVEMFWKRNLSTTVLIVYRFVWGLWFGRLLAWMHLQFCSLNWSELHDGHFIYFFKLILHDDDDSSI